MPPGNAQVAEAAALRFENKKGSDCIIRFYLEAEAAKRRRLDDGALRLGLEIHMQRIRVHLRVREPEGPLYVGEPLPAHQFVLSCTSQRFEAQLERWKDDERDVPTKQRKRGRELEVPSVPAAGVGSLPELLISLGSEDEVPSALAAIRYAYTGEVQAGSAKEVLKLRHQAGYLQIEGCIAACDAELKAKLEAGGGNTAASSSSESQRPPVLDFFAAHDLFPDDADPSFAAVLTLAKQKLVLHFADTVVTLNTPRLQSELLQLPAVAMEALLASDDLGTDSESSVLLLLAAWMRYNHGGTDLETRKRLCRLVRLVQLSRPYLSVVLPSLAADYEARLPFGWLPIPAMEVAFITSVSSAPPSEREILLRLARSIGTYDVSLPSYSTLQRRQCLPEGGTIPWHITQQQLQQRLRNLQPGGVVQLFGAQVIVHGFIMESVIHYKYGDAAAAVGMHCRVHWFYDVAGSCLALPINWVGVVSVKACISVARWPDGARGDDLRCHCDLAQISCITPGWNGTLPLKQQAAGGAAAGGSAASLAAWSDYIHDGKITGTLTILPPGGSGVNSAGAV